MDDLFIISNFNTLCRLCLCKCNFTTSIFGNVDDDGDSERSITSKIAECINLQMEPNDGLPARLCYKCLFQLNESAKFRAQCMQTESKLRQIVSQLREHDTSYSSEINYNGFDNQKVKDENYIVEDSVVMVVDPSLDYDSSEESENIEHNEPEAIGNDQIQGPNDHIQDSYLMKSVFMCQYCDQAFISEEKCKDHEQGVHDPNIPYKCVECSINFSERSLFIGHNKAVHRSDKPYQCPECEKCFGRRSDLRKHSIVHTGIRPYQCQYCHKSFSRNTNLSKHLRIHAGHKPHVCPMCPRSFVAKGDLQRHVLVHSGMKPYTCQKCPLSFGRKDKLLRHEMKHCANNNINQNTFDMVVNVNPYSNIMSPPSGGISDNIPNEYDLPSVPDHISGDSFLSQLQKTPSSSKQLAMSPFKQKSPISAKNKPKNIKCHQCPKRFSSLDAYKTHVSVAHLGLRLFQCKVCFKKFPRKRELDRHSLIHSEPKFECTQCGEKFSRKDKLVKHEKTHECLVVNMPCIECGAIFEKKPDLVAHIKSHFNDNFDDKIIESKIKLEVHSDFNTQENFNPET
ncbi:zinc finger protein 90-like [Leptidea sinapis]|uniref:Protein krueppel n=1 Tax=Leptidea sinapis TaxID=189913 RepID=A0A5E4PWN5_9NEOP|nr:zinc finger protein 90-like [Leptidea sinapis]VVC89558.1 unnamed protein product [Leptidea sinapis]